MKTNTLATLASGFVIGILVTTVFFNVHAHLKIAEDSNATLKTYWDGK